MHLIREASEKIRKWRNDPVSFVRDNFLVEPDFWQCQFLEALASNDPIKKRISLNACAGPGKTAALAWAGLWFLACFGHKDRHPKAVAIAVTRDNLKDNLWPELAKWMNVSPFLKSVFVWTKERIYNSQHPETWFMSARSWPKDADPDTQGATLSGIHSEYVFFIIDESGEIPTTVLRAAEQALGEAKGFGKIVQAGNPTSMDGMLYAAYSTLRHLWHVICITGDPDDPNRSQRIDIGWAKEQIKTYGRDNPWVMSYILGQFPNSSLNTLLSPTEIQEAMNRSIIESQYNFSEKRIGVDVARFGDDSTVIFPRQGLRAFNPAQMRNARSNEVAAKVAYVKNEFGSEREFIDGTGGWGAGVVDSLIQAGHVPIEVNFASKSTQDPRFYNVRAEIWFRMAEWVKKGGVLPDVPVLIRELSSPQFYYQDGKFRLEEKEQIKKRLQFSPDFGDALATTFYLQEMPTSKPKIGDITIPNRVQHVSDYDPFK